MKLSNISNCSRINVPLEVLKLEVTGTKNEGDKRHTYSHSHSLSIPIKS